ncbi:aquaporin-11 [Alligator mississippiensis]|nr:aquaporin-11 [Alligator mississippiensis]
MVLGGAWPSVLVLAGTVLLAGGGRRLVRPHPTHALLLEALGTFQVCACTHELRLLADTPPQPYGVLGLAYVLTVLHGLTLVGCTCNPCGTLQHVLGGGLTARRGALQLGAQVAGAGLARAYMHSLWGSSSSVAHARALAEGCAHPIRTTGTQAFCIELLFSAVFQLTLLHIESVRPRLRVHLVALLITLLVYGGGNLTGAIFNPALAFSLHTNCFHEEFWEYSLVYWIAPLLGTVFVAIVWDEILHLIF